MEISRRAILGGSSATVLAGCMSCPERLPLLVGSEPIGDAHTHFFNGSDLPVYGFIRYVASKEFGSNNLLVLGAANTVQAMATLFPIRAQAERRKIERQRRSATPLPLNVTKQEFAEDFAITLDDLAADSLDRLEDTSGELRAFNFTPDAFDISTATALDDDKGIVLLAAMLSKTEADTQNFAMFETDGDADFDISAMRSVLQTDPQKVLDILNDAPVDEQRYFSRGVSIKQIFTYIRWGYLLMQSRCALVGEYLRKIKAEAMLGNKSYQPKVMLNLMVDYDYWISRGTKEPPSSHISQIEFWDSYSRAALSEVDIQTFTGFDPLKFAVQKRLGAGETDFDKLKTLYKTQIDGRPTFAGFKIYPPMGFRPWNNSQLSNRNFIGTNGVGRRIIDLWEEDWGGKDARLGEALDDALADGYDFCLEHDIPILAHASPSVLTASNFRDRPNPYHWLQLIKNGGTSRSGHPYSKLRLNLGHFTWAESFINGTHIWSRQYIRELFELSHKGEANVYADIGMMSEFVEAYERGDLTLTKRFFDKVADFCDESDEKCERLMFGTDWIMLGHVAGHKNYLKLIINALDSNVWWSKHNRKENFLHLNLKRFLKL